MRNRRLNAQVTGSAERHEVSRVVCGVGNQESASLIDVMNVKRTAARHRSAQSARLVAIKYGEANALPMRSELERSSSPPVWVCGPDDHAFRTCVGAELSPSPFLTGKGTKSLSAMLARQFRRGDLTHISALKRTMSDGGIPLSVKHLPTDHARDHRECVRLSIFSVASDAAKSERGSLFHDVSRTLEILATIRTSERRPIDHRGRMASLPAKDRLGKIGLKFSSALGANLDH